MQSNFLHFLHDVTTSNKFLLNKQNDQTSHHKAVWVGPEGKLARGGADFYTALRCKSDNPKFPMLAWARGVLKIAKCRVWETHVSAVYVSNIAMLGTSSQPSL